jgi:hypothetical protein
MTPEDFKQTYHGYKLCELRDLIMSAPESSDRTKALELLTEIFKSAYGLWMLRGSPKE